MARACAIEGGQVAARCRAARHTAFSRQAEGSGRERRHAAVVEEGGRCDLLIRKDKRQSCLFAGSTAMIHGVRRRLLAEMR